MGADHGNDPASLRSLFEAARHGDIAAQRKLFEDNKNRVAAQIQRMTGDASVVDDLVQEVFIAAFSTSATFRGDSQLSTWLYRIALNKVRNWWDSQSRRQRREQRASSSSTTGVLPPDEQLEAEERREEFYQALQKLSRPLREAFVARVIEGMSLQECSDSLDAPISTVSYRCRKAEETLSKVLGVSSKREGQKK